ncbi:MAG: hypothetical protein Q9201_002267 [Fulgogasparrea decipioides]
MDFPFSDPYPRLMDGSSDQAFQTSASHASFPSLCNGQPAIANDGESSSGAASSPDGTSSFQPLSGLIFSQPNPRKRQRESLERPSLSAETIAKSRRTTPSPAVTGNTTPASFDSFDWSQDPHMLQVLGGNPEEYMADMMAEQKAQERELDARKEQERLDAEYAKQLAEEFEREYSNLPSQPSQMSSQTFLDHNGNIRRQGPSNPQALPSLPRPQTQPQTSFAFSSSQATIPSSSLRLPQRESARSPPPPPNDFDNYIVLSSDDPPAVPPTSAYGSTMADSAFDGNNGRFTSSVGSPFPNIATTDSPDETPPLPLPSTSSNTAQGIDDSGLGGWGGTSVYNNPVSTYTNPSGWCNTVSGYGQRLASPASGAWTSAQTLLGQQLGGYPSAGYGSYTQAASQSSTAPAVIDLDTYDQPQAILTGDFYRERARQSLGQDQELLDRYMDRLEYLTNDPTKTTDEIKDLLENIRPDEELPPENREGTPEAMVYPLMEHQKLGLAWMKSMEDGTNKGGILADGMGLGKTIQALALIVSRKSSDPSCKTTLIVAPIALLKQWEREIQTKLKSGREHRLTTYMLHGTGRAASWEQLRLHDVVLTTYGTLSTEIKRKELIEHAKRLNPNWTPITKADRLPLLGDECKWYRVILDEAQCIKNRNTKAAAGACALQAQTRFCMSGTPMQNSVTELYSLVRFLRIKPHNDLNRFNIDFTKPMKSSWPEEKRRGLNKLQVLLKAILLRRNKKSTIDGHPILNLPERSTESQHAEFSDDEEAFYTALETQSQLQFNKYLRAGTVGRNYSNVLVLLLRLRQACCHPHLIKDFGVSSGGTEVATADLVQMAKELAPDVVARIIEQGDINDQSGLECPVCMDATENATIFTPCGHNTCSECFARISDPSQAIANGDGGGTAIKCPSCRGMITTSKITDHNTFKKVHLHGPSTEEALVEELDGPSEDESETTDDETTDDEGSDLGGFVVDDGEETTDDEEGYRKGETPFERCSKTPRSKEKSSKGKGKAEDRPPRKTLAQLKKESLRNMKARKKYVARLRKDWESSAKITRTMDILQEIQDSQKGEKTIIFSQFTSLLDLLEVPIYDKGWKYKRYDGSMSAEARNEAVLEFTDKRECKIMLVSLKAGNAGLNLVAASQVIIMDPFWNPYVEEQAIDRAHRIGQQRPVQVHRILISGTVEDRILALQEQKRAMIESALDENASKEMGRLGVRELGYLFVGCYLGRGLPGFY